MRHRAWRQRACGPSGKALRLASGGRPPVPGLLAEFKPHLKYLLIDENAYSESQLSSLKNLVAAVFRFERPDKPETISDLLSLLKDWLQDRPDLRRMFALWIRATLMRKTEYRIVLPEIDDLQELNVMLAERLEEWAHGYEAQGVQKGMQQGSQQAAASMLTSLMRARFGALPDAVTLKINESSSEVLAVWFERALNAKTIDDIFSDAAPH